MVRPREGTFTEPALEWPISGVFPVMPSQLVGSGEPPAAAFPAAEVRLLSRVCPQMRLEVARLGVRLVARLVAARVDRHLLPAPTSPASLL